MAEEALVLDGDERVDGVRRDLVERDSDAVFFVDGRDQLVVRIVDERRFGGVVDDEMLRELFDVGAQYP